MATTKRQPRPVTVTDVTLRPSDVREFRAPRDHHRHLGAGRLSRRQLLGATAAGIGAVAAGSLLRPASAHHLPTTSFAPTDPRPINGGLGPFHVYAPAYKPAADAGIDPDAVWEQSTITDFEGTFASTDVEGWGTDGDGRELYFRCDMRFVEGTYVALNGSRRRGSFGFI